MRIRRIDNQEEKNVLTGMIVDDTVLGRVSTAWGSRRSGLFRTRWANMVGGWCVDFYMKYGGAPGKAIESLFQEWAETVSDKDTVALIEKFLATLSDDYETLGEESNSEYVIDMAGRYFNKISMESLADTIQTDLEAGQVEKAQAKIVSFGNIEMGVGSAIDIFQDEQAIRNAFEQQQEALVKYPGALGRFFKNSLARECFVAFLGPEKRGKSWWLLDVAFRAMSQRRKVAFFEVGDLGKSQSILRFMTRVVRRPLGIEEYKYPLMIERDPDERLAEVEHDIRKESNRLSWRKAWKICQKAITHKIKSQESYLKLSVHPNRTLTVEGARDILRGWERDGWIPDVVVFDYADILKMNKAVGETRDQIDDLWGRLRALSQQHHCLVVTATQSDTVSYRVETLSMDNFSNSKAKNAHVTAIIGLNQLRDEKEQGIMRLNYVVLRESDYTNMKCCHVAGCLSIANPAIRSTF